MSLQANITFRPDRQFAGKTQKAIERALTRQGALVRKIAMQSMRSSGKKGQLKSKPGQPPRSRTGALKRFILFAFDPASQSVVVGPKRLPRRISGQPNALETGGNTRILADQIAGTTRVTYIAKRPYMAPALRTARDKLPELFEGMYRYG